MSDSIKILICDDSLLVRKKLKEILQQFGNFTTLDAADGQAAVDMFREHRPDLVFMDIVMPVRDGIEALKEIRECDGNAKVVMVSSSGTQSNLASVLECGAIDFLQKPLDASRIIPILARIVKESEGKTDV